MRGCVSPVSAAHARRIARRTGRRGLRTAGDDDRRQNAGARPTAGETDMRMADVRVALPPPSRRFFYHGGRRIELRRAKSCLFLWIQWSSPAMSPRRPRARLRGRSWSRKARETEKIPGGPAPLRGPRIAAPSAISHSSSSQWPGAGGHAGAAETLPGETVWRLSFAASMHACMLAAVAVLLSLLFAAQSAVVQRSLSSPSTRRNVNCTVTMEYCAQISPTAAFLLSRCECPPSCFARRLFNVPHNAVPQRDSAFDPRYGSSMSGPVAILRSLATLQSLSEKPGLGLVWSGSPTLTPQTLLRRPKMCASMAARDASVA